MATELDSTMFRDRFASEPRCHSSEYRALSTGGSMNRHSFRTVVISCTLAILCQIAPGCTEPTFDQMIREGERERMDGNYAEALGMFRMASERDGERPEPSYLIGKCYMGMADKQFREDDLIGAIRYCDRAIASFDSAISAFPGYSKAVQGKADALKLRGKHQAAYDIARWVAAQSGYEPKKLIIEAQQYSSSGDLDNAQLALQKAVAVDENNPLPHAELGRFYMRMGNREKAIASLRRAYDLNPGIPGVFEALLDLGGVTPDMKRS